MTLGMDESIRCNLNNLGKIEIRRSLVVATGAISSMGIIIGISFLALVLVGMMACAVTLISTLRNRKYRLYRFVSLFFFVVGPILPIFFSAPASAVTSEFHKELEYFIAATFSLTNTVVAVGSLLLIIPLFIRNNVARVVSAASWGLLSAYVVNVVRLMILIRFF